MKTYKLSIILLLGVLATSCATESYDYDTPVPNAVYIGTAEETPYNVATFKKTITEFERTFCVKLISPADEDMTVGFGVDPSGVDAYNLKHSTDCEILPAQYYTLSGNRASVAKGKTVSPSVSITFKGLDALEIDRVYVLPISLTDVSTGTALLKGSATVDYLLKRSSAITDAAELHDNWIEFPTLDQDRPQSQLFNNLHAVTYECLVWFDEFSTSASISSIMGVEQYLLLRMGDTNYERRQIQFDGSGAGFGKFPESSKTKLLDTGRWYHIAVTCDQVTGEVCVYVDGQLQSLVTDYASTEPINLAMRAMHAADPAKYASFAAAYQFKVGYSYNEERPLNGKIAEVRVWSVARTREQIWESMYEVDPTTAGLLGYWKFNEGSGNTVHDATTNGNHGVAKYNLAWPAGIEIPQINRE